MEAGSGGHPRAARSQPGKQTLLGRRSREEAGGRPDSPEGSVSSPRGFACYSVDTGTSRFTVRTSLVCLQVFGLSGMA